MMRSMFSAVSGLRVHQTRMDVIAHNLANVNTAGFKASRTTFMDVFSQTLQHASQANERTGRGGQNPMQVGLGANISAIDRRMTQGAAMRTDVPLDLMINGEGFFIVGDATGNFFTRAGAFRLDPTTGWLVNDQGMPLMGWNADENFNIQSGVLERITLDRWDVPAETTSLLQILGNLDPARPLPPPNMTMDIFDSLGTRWVMDVEFLPEFEVIAIGPPPVLGNVPIAWDMQLGGPGGTAVLRREGTTETITIAAGWDTQRLWFNDAGGFHAITPTTVTTRPAAPGLNAWVFQIDPAGPPANAVFGENFGTTFTNGIALDFSRFTQFSMMGSDPHAHRPLSGNVAVDATGQVAAVTTQVITARGGMRAGRFDGIAVGPDGIVRGRFTNGEILPLAQIPVAVFRNPAGLEAVGNNLFVETANSGTFDGIGQDVSLGGATLMGGVLEMSNVDLAAEFTDMIITQRGFQSNSRVITVSDEMLQILNNI